MATWTFSPSCYRLQDIEYDWVTAWLKCQELGAHLAIERDTDEHLGLSQYLQGLGRTEDYWIGGRKTLDTAPLSHSSFQWITEFRGTQNKCQGGSDRVNCTEMGVGLTCEVLGCCWDNTTTTPGLPACYFPYLAVAAITLVVCLLLFLLGCLLAYLISGLEPHLHVQGEVIPGLVMHLDYPGSFACPVIHPGHSGMLEE
ncbi:uncharacterized protein LOC118413587 [Branchiostoma floridae]|uniref:Uncharacterized protein LOC118413587 n=1 Tax=Branchiostoma floridae TaxID=7739 RepID=A0A9J7MM71_BRAFL|nr:uncharacterized protein LOC118413587 [Branchiostoma floridae]